jgi:hypothetical protein
VTLQEEPPRAAYAPRMDGPEGERGGALARLLGALLVLLLLASAGLFIYTRTQDPLSVGPDAAIGFNEALADHGDPTAPVVKLEPNGQIYLATTVRNDGSLPITITGIGKPPDEEQTPYIPVELRLGDGESTDPAASASFTPTKLGSGEGIGVLVVFAGNSKLICSLFTETSEGSGTEIHAFTLDYTTFGIPDTQTLDLGRAFADVARPTRTECVQALGG